MYHASRLFGLAIAVAAVPACLPSEAPPSGPASAGALSVSVAALNLSGVGDAVWDIEVLNGDDDVVWQRRLTSSGYGDGAGSASYVGTCDASVGVSDNAVRVWVVGVYAGAVTASGSFNGGSDAGVGAVTGTAVPFQNPTSAALPLEQDVVCVANADVAVQFDVALMRPAQQGFFDIAVNFNDIFCSAKLDCCADANGNDACDANEDIALLFDASGARASTMVLGFACTAGAADDVQTQLYLDPLQLDCTTPTSWETFGADITINPAGAAGNQCTSGDNGMSTCTGVITESGVDADVYLFQVGVYRGLEQLLSGGVSAQKVYWNIALGVKRPAIEGCWLRTRGTADDAAGTGIVDLGNVAAGAVYPYIQWEADLGACVEEPLDFDDAAAMVRPEYTATDGAGLGFTYGFGAAMAAGPFCATACQNGGQCVSGACVCPAGYSGASCQTNDDDCDPDPCQNGGVCTDGVDAFTCACPAGFEGTLCETNIDDCDPNPCQNGGTCADGVDSFTCDCPAGYTGTLCESYGASFVAVGVDGAIMSSDDGINWTVQSGAPSAYWQGIAHGDGTWLVTSATHAGGSRVMTSPDGVTWTERPTPGLDGIHWGPPAYGGGRFVVPLYDGTFDVAVSPDHGITWTRFDAPSLAYNWRRAMYGGGIWVLFGGSAVAYSLDGAETWTLASTPVSNQWSVGVYTDGRFVIVPNTGANSGSDILTSTDGLHWTTASNPLHADWERGVYAAGRFVVVGRPDNVLTSVLGDSWATPVMGGAGLFYTGLAHHDGLFVALSLYNGASMTSADGVSWTSRTAPVQSWSDLAAVTSEPVPVCTPVYADAITWIGKTSNFTVGDADTDGDTHDITPGNGVNSAIRAADAFALGQERVFGWTVGGQGHEGMGIYEVTEDATFDLNRDRGAMQDMTMSWGYYHGNGSNQLFHGGNLFAGPAVSVGDDVALRVAANGTVTFEVNGSVAYTFPVQATGALRWVVSCGNNLSGHLLYDVFTQAECGIPQAATADPVWWLDAADAASYPGSGTTWSDLASGFDFSMEGAPTFHGPAGARGAYFDFDRDNRFRAVADYTGTWLRAMGNAVTSFGVEAMIYIPASSTGWHTLMGTSGFSSEDGIGFNYTDGSNRCFLNLTPSSVTFEPTMPSGGWHHLVWTGRADGVTDITLWIDGVQAGAAQHTTSGTWSDSTNRMRIGHHGDIPAPASYLAYGMEPGSGIAYIRGYARVLSGDEVLRNFEAERDRFGL